MKILLKILSWSEVWALFLPLTVLFMRKEQPRYAKPVILYLFLALLLNLTADIITEFKVKWHFPRILQSNTILYNVHSVIRFSCFTYFFILLRQPFLKGLKRLIPYVFVLFFIVDFLFVEPFYNADQLSGNLFTAEAYLLLVYCILYYLYQLKKEPRAQKRGKDFWIVLGLSIYVILNFFIFLFYDSMLNTDKYLAIGMWRIHDAAYIILNFFIAKAFYVSDRL